jgi:hypothetical protein
MNGNEEYFRSLVATYIGGRIVLAVKKHFADPPCHQDVCLVRLIHPNHYSHSTYLIQRQSASGRRNKREILYLNELEINI